MKTWTLALCLCLPGFGCRTPAPHGLACEPGLARAPLALPPGDPPPIPDALLPHDATGALLRPIQ